MTSNTLRHKVIRILLSAAVVVGFAGTSLAFAPMSAAASASPNTVELRVLVLSDGSPNVSAIRAQFERVGVPITVVDTASASRPVIDDAYLADEGARRAHFQGIVLAGPAVISEPELAAVARFERTYGVREITAYAYPNAGLGLNAPFFSGVLDGTAASVTAAAKDSGFGYLRGPLRIDDVDPAVPEVYGYLATPQDPQAEGARYTSLLDATFGGVTGSMMGVYSADGRSRMVITVAFNANQQYFMQLGPGLVNWLTRGVYLGHWRNYFDVHVDDVFMADSQWSPVGKCTPGDDCFGEFANLTTPDIRMAPADVTHLVDWQATHGMSLDMVFNGGGSEAASTASHDGTDPLLAAFQANVGAFEWINHTYTHEYLGCIQVAPPAAGQPWHCATPADYQDPATTFIEPDLAQFHQQLDPATGVYYLTQAEVTDQIARNLAWAQQQGISTDQSTLVTGEHSGLAILPQQPVDNPSFAASLAAAQVSAVAADASRERDSRMAGPARTVPRHPMNIFYNVDSYAGEVSEYNWYYTRAVDGGSGICERQPQITTCITPLPAATPAQAQTSFTDYILPTETRIALSFVLSNDPRPFFVHQSNLTGQRILFPLLERILGAYGSAYDTATTPLVHLGLAAQAAELARMALWRTASSTVTAYLDASGVHVDSAGTDVPVPVTVPAGSTVNGVTLTPYGGTLSGWILPPPGNPVIAVPPTPSGGFVGVPDPPVVGAATAGNASATVTWTAAPDGGSPVTDYLVRVYLADNIVPARIVPAPAGATAATVTDLLNYASYTFTVSAVSAVGPSDESARSNAVVPLPTVPAAPVIGTATSGDGNAAVSWTAPADGGSPLLLYTVRLYRGSDTVPSSAQDVVPPATAAAFTGLTNGVAYSFDVFAYNAFGPGPASDRSAPVTPRDPTKAGPPTITSAVAGRRTADVAWSAPADPGTTAIDTYLVRAYAGDGATPAMTVSVPGSARRATLVNLIPGTGYTVDVVAVNGAGPGDPSARSGSIMPIDVPAAPTLTSLTASNRSLTVRWTPPADNGAAISNYLVSLYVGTSTVLLRRTTVAGTASSLVVGGLANGVAYTVSVQAVNAVGAGPASARSAVVRPAAARPGPPTIQPARPGAVGGLTSAIATWLPPAVAGDASVTRYLVTAHRVDPVTGTELGTASWPALGGSARSLEMTLLPGSYFFTVQAMNVYGGGAASAASNVVVAR